MPNPTMKNVNIDANILATGPMLPDESTESTLGGTFGIESAPKDPTMTYMMEEMRQDCPTADSAFTSGAFSYNQDGTAVTIA
mmetsp:Transcript_8721/g.12913  ORF Transcript_8721/g.12913 Transcript_8721/m.12913 type:complete len:82 (-) Transcript_8721:9-254(-)